MSAVAETEPGVATPPPAGRPRATVREQFLLDMQPGESVTFVGLSWADYQRLMDFRDVHRTGVRITYDRGRLFAMSVGAEHERWKRLLGRLLEALALATDLPLVSVGNMTVSRESADRGLEPDECFYVQRAAQVLAVRNLDFETDPPPDLAVEIEMTRGAAGKLPVYAALGVPEVWWWDGERLTVLHRTPAGEYAERPTSLAFPTLPPDVLASYLRRAGTVQDTSLCRELFTWAAARTTPPETA